MTDNEIIGLFFARSEEALTETDRAYGAYCRSLTMNILGSREDSEECVNDTYMKLWEEIPPKRPPNLGAFTAKIARNLALNRRSAASAAKRGGGLHAIDYDEIAGCLPDRDTVERQTDERELTEALERFLRALPNEKRLIFMKRYWGFMSVSDIALEMNISETKVKTTLHRTREKLRKFLGKEGIEV
jgi:RNA polymerase sigma-70 factor (ECF subfamily)